MTTIPQRQSKELMIDVLSFLNEFTDWARRQTDIEAVALVGSHARGQSTNDSDIDLVVVTRDVDRYLSDPSWVSEFGQFLDCREESYGKVTSLRVFYIDGPEVEFGFASIDWTAQPIDEGTLRVLRGGIKILYDPRNLIDEMMRAIAQ